MVLKVSELVVNMRFPMIRVDVIDGVARLVLWKKGKHLVVLLKRVDLDFLCDKIKHVLKKEKQKVYNKLKR